MLPSNPGRPISCLFRERRVLSHYTISFHRNTCHRSWTGKGYQFGALTAAPSPLVGSGSHVRAVAISHSQKRTRSVGGASASSSSRATGVFHVNHYSNLSAQDVLGISRALHLIRGDRPSVGLFLASLNGVFLPQAPAIPFDCAAVQRTFNVQLPSSSNNALGVGNAARYQIV
jgi:hypothetical protein